MWVANDNAAGQVVISGTHEGVSEAASALASAGARRVVPLPVSGPFHSPLMAGAAESFGRLLSQAAFSDARYPVVSEHRSLAGDRRRALRSRLMAQITSPVRWTETMAALVADGPVTLIEAGPGAVLSGLAKRVEGATAVAVEAAGLEAIVEEVL